LPVGDPERYEQLGEHARGGIGRITRARDRQLGRLVAVKQLLRRDAGHEARFVREALITARLDHPGIVAVHEAGVWPSGEPYYVMKLVAGRTLHERLGEARDARARLALLPHVLAVADACGYAHGEGVVHRDIKPANVVCGEHGETVVVDWGLAHDGKLALPEIIDEDVLGTPAYMAPELAAGGPIDPRADVYAIGAMIYELLAGAPPYCNAAADLGATASTPRAILARAIAGPPAPVAGPRELRAIVATAMARDPARRYPDARALASALRAFQNAAVSRVPRRPLARVAAGMLAVAAVGAAVHLATAARHPTTTAPGGAGVFAPASTLPSAQLREARCDSEAENEPSINTDTRG
jgi:serine/threonine protein kinase